MRSNVAILLCVVAALADGGFISRTGAPRVLKTDTDSTVNTQAVIKGRFGSGSEDTADIRIDASTHSMQTIDYAHHEAHSGAFFYVKGWLDITGAGNDTDFIWIVPDTSKWPHAQWSFDGEAEFTLTLYEGVTLSDSGTESTILNVNRNSAKEPVASLYVGEPVLVSGALGDGGNGGTAVWATKIGSARSATTGRATSYEFIAKQNTIYWFRLTKEAAGTGWVSFDFNWYEHTDKD